MNVVNVVTYSLKSSTSLNKSEFTIVAEPYKPVELIDIFII
jgi:hypothetical protein